MCNGIVFLQLINTPDVYSCVCNIKISYFNMSICFNCYDVCNLCSVTSVNCCVKCLQQISNYGTVLGTLAASVCISCICFVLLQ
jgi:hypothetical protein